MIRTRKVRARANDLTRSHLGSEFLAHVMKRLATDANTLLSSTKRSKVFHRLWDSIPPESKYDAPNGLCTFAWVVRQLCTSGKGNVLLTVANVDIKVAPGCHLRPHDYCWCALR